MADHNKVVWKEGLLLTPHHFQQQERFLARSIERRTHFTHSLAWGLNAFEYVIDRLREKGELELKSASGVFPDGTVFDVPVEEGAPDVLKIPPGVNNKRIYLALPERRAGSAEVARASRDGGAAFRYAEAEQQVLDVASEDGQLAPVSIGRLQLKLLLGDDAIGGYTVIPVLNVLESKEDGQVRLDDMFIPPCVNIQVSTALSSFLEGLDGQFEQRAATLAGRISQGRRAANMESADFFLLQIVNRCAPMLRHMLSIDQCHPRQVYEYLIQLLGELSTYSTEERRPPQLRPYVHDDLKASFAPVMAVLREYMSQVDVQGSQEVPLTDHKNRFFSTNIGNGAFFDDHEFVLAVKSAIAENELRGRVPGLIKIASPNSIQKLLQNNIMLVPPEAMSVAPRQVRYAVGYVYFRLRQDNQFWQEIVKGGNLAIFVGADFPEFDMKLWAIRKDS